MSTTLRPSPLALAVLGLLEDGPLHPYRMQQLIKMWGKDEVINVGQRASLYRTISRLLDAGLIKVYGTTRDQQYPERTSYELTDAGRHARQQWLAQTLTTPRNEYPEFPAALSFLPLITPDIADTLLSTRRDRLVERLSERDAAISLQSNFYGGTIHGIDDEHEIEVRIDGTLVVEDPVAVLPLAQRYSLF